MNIEGCKTEKNKQHGKSIKIADFSAETLKARRA
jgi:hypothetical protein